MIGWVAKLVVIVTVLCVPGRAAARDADALALASVHAVVAGIGGAPVYRKYAEHAVPIASLTKLMTAYVVLEADQPLDAWLPVVPREHEPPNNAYSRIRVGSELPRGELLRIMLMASENLAAHTVASHYPGGREGFVAAMNATAGRLGMTRSRFVDPSGLSPENVASAADLATLVQAAYAYDVLRRYTTTSHHAARFRSPRYQLAYGNTNELVGRSRWDVRLSKTGYLSESGRCLATVVVIDGEPMAMVLLDSFGTRSPLGDVGRIKRWLTTGASGSVARAAREYEQRRSSAYDS
jgi:D-alanyl-D-alanine endopeptidase (penicillin-binding protein 7)